MVKVNGIFLDVSGKTFLELLEIKNYDKTRVAIECNGNIVPKKEYESRTICDGDSIEIVCFVGGG